MKRTHTILNAYYIQHKARNEREREMENDCLHEWNEMKPRNKRNAARLLRTYHHVQSTKDVGIGTFHINNYM